MSQRTMTNPNSRCQVPNSLMTLMTELTMKRTSQKLIHQSVIQRRILIMDQRNKLKRKYHRKLKSHLITKRPKCATTKSWWNRWVTRMISKWVLIRWSFLICFNNRSWRRMVRWGHSNTETKVWVKLRGQKINTQMTGHKLTKDWQKTMRQKRAMMMRITRMVNRRQMRKMRWKTCSWK